ncbi:MAG TPA: hypothetical protein VG944_03470 [Fimbriimonas sp.]|nr:hypothetical protein [Fimbriimonas sp.]
MSRLSLSLRHLLIFLAALSLSLAPTQGLAQILTKVSISPATVYGGDNATGTVQISSPAPSGGFLVSINCNHDFVQFPTGVAVPGGATGATFPLGTSQVTHASSATITCTANDKTVTAGITVEPPAYPVDSITVSPNPVIGGVTTYGTVHLNQVAGLAGITVQLKSSGANVHVPAHVTVAHGSSSAEFSITSGVVSSASSATITGSVLGVSGSTTANLEVDPWPVSSVDLSPNPVVGTYGVTGKVTLGARAPFGGIVVQLSTDNSVATPAASSVTVKQGYLTATFRVKTLGVGTQQVAHISATAGGTPAGSALTINASPITSVVLNQASVYGGANLTGSVTVADPAPTGGQIVQLTASSTDVQVPTSVTVPAGYKSAKFAATSSGVSAQEQVTVTGYAGTAQASDDVTLLTHVQIVNLPVNDIAFDKVSGKIWATVKSTGGVYANSVVSIDPTGGAIGVHINMGPEPGLICVSDDGQFAYVSVGVDGSVRRADLQSGTVGPTFPIGVYNPYDLEAVPGSPHSWVTCTDPYGGVNTRVWDDGVARANTAAGGYRIVFAGTSDIIYGDGHNSLFKSILKPNEIDWVDQTGLDVTGCVWSKHLLYTDLATVIDPEAKAIVENLPTQDFGNYNFVAVNSNENRIYYLTADNYGNTRILAFDQTTYAEKRFIESGNIPGALHKPFAVGNHTIAFESTDNQAVGVVFVHDLH